jgi:hypothetical protein
MGLGLGFTGSCLDRTALLGGGGGVSGLFNLLVRYLRVLSGMVAEGWI